MSEAQTFVRQLVARVGLPPASEAVPHVRTLLRAELAKDLLCVERIDDLALLCAFMLFLHGDVADCALLWEVKRGSMDLYVAIDGELTLGAGVEPTLRFLEEARRVHGEQYAHQQMKRMEESGRLRRFDRNYWVGLYMNRFSP